MYREATFEGATAMGFFDGFLKPKKSVFFSIMMEGRDEVCRHFGITDPDIVADFHILFALGIVVAACIRVPIPPDDDVYNRCVADIERGLVTYFSGRTCYSENGRVDAGDYMRQCFAGFTELVDKLVKSAGDFGLDLSRAAMDFLITTLEKNNIAKESEFYMIDRMAMDSLMSAYMMQISSYKTENLDVFGQRHLRVG